MPVDPIDSRLGANLRRVITDKGNETVLAFYSNCRCPFTLDWLYKRIRGVHSLRLRDVLPLAEVLNVDPVWLAAELVNQAGDRDCYLRCLSEAEGLSIEEIEHRLEAHLQIMTWRQAQRLLELGQITL